MTILFEQAGMLLLLGALAEAIAIGALMNTGRKEALGAVIVVPLVVLGLLAVERLVVTEREQVSNTIEALAQAVENNDLPAVLDHLSQRMPEARVRAQVEFPQYKFSEVDVKDNLRVEVFPDNIPPKATATFNVTVLVSDRRGMIANQRVARFVELTLYQEDGRWRVGEYDHHDPLQGM